MGAGFACPCLPSRQWRKANGMRATATITVLALVSGCVAAPSGPTVSVLPAPGKPFERFAEEDAYCKQFARQQVTGAPEQANDQVIASAVVGTVLGTALGGAIAGGQGAGVGATAGALLGPAPPSGNSPRSPRSLPHAHNTGYRPRNGAQGHQTSARPRVAPAHARPP